MGRPINAQRFLGATAPHQIQATVWGTADSGSTAGYLAQQNSPRRFRTTTINGSSITTFVNGPGNLVAGTSFVKVFPLSGSAPTVDATGSAKLKAVSLAVANGGANYQVGDTVTLVGGAFTAAAHTTVATLGSGNSIATLNAIAGGTEGYTALPANVLAIATSTNSANGHGAILSANFGVESASVLTGGAGYTTAQFLVNGATTAPTFTQPTVTNGVVATGAVTVLTPGVVNVNPTVTIEEATGATEYVSTLTSMNYLNTFQGNQYRWLYRGQAVPSDYAALGVKLAYLDTL